MSCGNSYIVQHYSGHIQDARDTLKRQPLSHATFTGSGLPVPLAGNIFADKGYLRSFHAGIILDGPNQASSIRTTFYDTSGTPVGTEPELFTFISFAQKISSTTEGFTENDFKFEEKGMYFNEGIGFMTEPVLGTPTILQVDALLCYVKSTDVYEDN